MPERFARARVESGAIPKYRLLILFLLAFSLAPALAGAAPGPVEEWIREKVELLRDRQRVPVAGGELVASALLPCFYEQRDFLPAWNDPDVAEQLLAGVRAATSHGLDPSDYQLDAIENLQRQLAGHAAPPPEMRANLDLLLTEGLIRLTYHLHFGKVDPEALHPGWNLQREIVGADAVQLLEQAIAGGAVTELIDRVQPQHPVYARLRQALSDYRRLQEAGGWPGVPAGPSLRPGMQEARVTALRRRLRVTGELSSEPAGDPTRFDEPLLEAVIRFQQRHGLAADGVVGPATLAALNVPATLRVDQIRANLERARWVLPEARGDYIEVDIAGFHAAYHRGGEVVWEGRTQVGKPYRSTPVLKSAVNYLVLNPTWTVPPTILAEDILPELRRDPGYLQQRGLVVLDRSGRRIDPDTVDWSRYRGRNFPYLLRQEPGPENALGRIKFMFPNKHLVYLHDTPSRNLFQRTERTFSSGCIRIENPDELAALLLEPGDKWDRDRLAAAIESRATRTVFLPQPVPILLLYWTVNVTADGTVMFKKDIYERDPPLLEALGRSFAFPSKSPIRNESEPTVAT